MRLSVIVPAHNEEAVIQRCLDTMLRGENGGDLDVVVVCNGCTDETARIARSFPVRVIELEQASKVAALNAGDCAAAHFPRFYVDADITVTADDLVRAASVLSGSVHAVSPAMKPVLDGRPWAVCAFYRVWNELPYCQSLIGSGVYGLDREARMRFDEFPPIIADDLFARLQVRADERLVAPGTSFNLETPRTVRSLVKVKTRAHLGVLELRDLRPDLFVNEDVDHGHALRSMARSPDRWPEIFAYVAIRAVSRARAAAQHRKNLHHRWERDETSRSAS